MQTNCHGFLAATGYNRSGMAISLPLVEGFSDPRPSIAAAITGPRDIRSVRTLRISVTDRCNFRCVYCMPEEKLDWVPRDELLTFEEIVAVARAALRHGITEFKLTGGEPLVRHDLPRLVGLLRTLSADAELSMTTNGSLLNLYAAELKKSGLNRLTVSLDTLDASRFRDITRGADIKAVWAGIATAQSAGFSPPKINCVAMRGINDDEFADFAALTLDVPRTVRFIEYMPLGRTQLGGEYEARFISESDIRRCIEARFGPLEPASQDSGAGPAKVWRVPGAAGRIGFISAMSKPFCETCNRLRLTAEGQLRSCLFDGGEVELRPILRESRSDAAAERLHRAFIDCVAFKPQVHSYHGNRQMSQIGG
ncbi:MAG: cyclic pyranopterin monophosphate synthase [Phycisphaerae bacterium]|nr:MAG: GTP 3',8-cyclase MoaA [Planctomycetota bacterium]GJQ27641.1 MAG: cyclic pyranopterin monophosphate synthase [Phycisphaerae bacterium]